MKALAVWPDRRTSGLVDHPAPSPSTPSDVTLRMLEVGVCGTDREIAAFEYGTPPEGSPYLVIGHESLAEVTAAGPGAAGFAPGQLVVATVRRPCPDPECDACRAGRQDFCRTGGYRERGIKGAHGFMTETVVEDARWLVPVPAGLRDVAVLVEPLTIAEKALLELSAMQDRMPWHAAAGRDWHAVVLGGGPVGLLGAMAFRAAGYRVTLVSKQPATDARANLLAAIGGAYVSAERASLTDLVAGLGRVDVIYEATGAAPPAFEALEALGPNGMFVFTGVPGRKGTPDVDGGLLMRSLVLGNKLAFGTVNAGRDAFERAVDDLGRFMARWPDAVRALITARVPLAQAAATLAASPTGIKTVVQIAGS